MQTMVPFSMASHFEAAKSARLLSVVNVDEAGSGWMLVRLLGDWLRLCAMPSLTGKSDICVVALSFYRDFDFYASGLSQFGIDLKQHEAQGHFKFIGGMYAKLLGESPSMTLQETVELLSDEAKEAKKSFGRTILLLDSPEVVMTLVSDNPRQVQTEWVQIVESMAYQFDHAIVAVAQDSPTMGRTRAEFEDMYARVLGVKNLGYSADMSMIMRHHIDRNSSTDGTVRITYSDRFAPARPDIPANDEVFGYSIAADGHTVTINES